MSTRSTIAIKNKDNTFSSVYCHYDGYNHDKGVGPTLRKYYNSENAAKKIIASGNLSFIDQHEIGAYDKKDGKKTDKNKAENANNKEALFKVAYNSDADFIYIFDNNQWIAHQLKPNGYEIIDA